MSSPSVLRNVIQPKSIPDQTSVQSPVDFEQPTAALVTQKENDIETQLGILVENAPVALSMFDDQMRYIVANRSWIEEFGLRHVQPLIGRSQYEIFPGLHPGWRQVYDRALQGHVVRSEHDAISGQDGKAIVYRWEVRPWRRKHDASVGGLMVICEKFASELGPAARDADMPAAPVAGAVHPASTLEFQSSLPVVMLDEKGTIIQANDAAVRISLSRGIREGVSFYWDAFSEGNDHASLKVQTLASISELSRDSSLQHQSIVTRTTSAPIADNDTRATLPARWVLSKVTGSLDQPKYLAVAMPGASPFDVEMPKMADRVTASPPIAGPGSSVDAAVLQELREKLDRTQQEIDVLREAEVGFAKREARQRAVLEALACGLVVLDERGMPIYHNQQIARLMGRGIQRGESVAQWLMEACPTPDHKEKVAGIWAQDVWSRQLTRVISLTTSDGMLRELELRPVPLSGGGVLVNIHDITEQCRTEDLLQSTEARFRVLLQDCPAGVMLADKAGALFEVNPVAEVMIGHSKASLRRMTIDECLSPESTAARKEALWQMREEGRRSVSLDVQIRHADGTLRPANLRISLVNDNDGQPHCTLHIFQWAIALESESSPPKVEQVGPPNIGDVQNDGGSPATLEDKNEPRTTVRWLLQTDQGGRIANWSADALEVFGFEAAEIVGTWLHGLFRPSDPTGFYADLEDRVASPDEAVTWGFFGKEGLRGSSRFFVKSAGDGGIAVDLFEEHETQAAPLQSSQPSGVVLPRTHFVKPSQLWPVADLDREKLLLSETHHRIKNHLQIISSMLNLQLNSLVDQGARAALRSSQNRVRSIAALHQHLYQLALGEGPGFEEFAKGLSQRLRECYEVPEEQVALQFEISAGSLQQEWMMPLALILNETLSNAFEHAFPANRCGTVTVRLSLDDTAGEFEVRDNGIGLPENFDPAISPGLGLKILGVFADQMRGELRLSGEPEGGAKFNLRFPMAHVDN